MRVYKSCCCEVLPIEYLMLVRCGQEDDPEASDIIYSPNTFADEGVYATTVGECYRALGYVEFHSEPDGLVTVLSPYGNCTKCLCCKTATSQCRAFTDDAKAVRTHGGSAYARITEKFCAQHADHDAAGSNSGTDTNDYDLCEEFSTLPGTGGSASSTLWTDDGFSGSATFSGAVNARNGNTISFSAGVSIQNNMLSWCNTNAAVSYTINLSTGAITTDYSLDPYRFGVPSGGTFEYSWGFRFGINFPCGGGSYSGGWRATWTYQKSCWNDSTQQYDWGNQTEEAGVEVYGNTEISGFEPCDESFVLPSMTRLVACDGSETLWTPQNVGSNGAVRLLDNGKCYVVASATEVAGEIWVGRAVNVTNCEDERCGEGFALMSMTAPAEGGAPETEQAAKSKLPLGDYVAKATEAVGIKPCGGCKKRQAKLNEIGDKIARKITGSEGGGA